MKVTELRKAKGYTQKQLATESEVNLRTLQKYESGEKAINKASAETLRKLAQALGCQIEDLLEIGK